MRLLHRCDGKVYGPKDAKLHDHSKNPSKCLKGWREATTREQWEAENYECLTEPCTCNDPAKKCPQHDACFADAEI